MKMLCLWNFGKTAATNEEYRQYIRSFNRIMCALGVTGAITLALGVANELFSVFTASGHSTSLINGMFTGFGTGLIVVSFMRILRSRKVLKDEEALKAERLKYSDERNQLIRQNAIKGAAFTMLIAAYCIMLASAFYNMVMFYSFFALIMLFFISFYLYSMLLDKKM